MARFGFRRGDAEGGEDQDPAPLGGPEDPGLGSPGDFGAPGDPGVAPPPPPPPPGSEPVPGLGPEPTLSERVEGQRAWLAQLDRRIGVRTYAGAAALVIALAAAAVAIVLVLQLQDDSATDTEIQQLREEIATVEDTAAEAAQEDVQSLSERLTAIESQISETTSSQDATDRQLSVVEDDIQDLRDQIADLEAAADDSGGGSAGGADASP